MPKDTYADVLGLVAQALADEVGVVVTCHDPTKLRQRIERALRELNLERPPISILTRATPIPCVLLVKTEFMDGKKLNVEKAAQGVRSRPGPPPGPSDVV